MFRHQPSPQNSDSSHRFHSGQAGSVVEDSDTGLCNSTSLDLAHTFYRWYSRVCLVGKALDGEIREAGPVLKFPSEEAWTGHPLGVAHSKVATRL